MAHLEIGHAFQTQKPDNEKQFCLGFMENEAIWVWSKGTPRNNYWEEPKEHSKDLTTSIFYPPSCTELMLDRLLVYVCFNACEYVGLKKISFKHFIYFTFPSVRYRIAFDILFVEEKACEQATVTKIQAT